MSERTQQSPAETITTHQDDVSFFIGRDGLIVPQFEFYLVGEAKTPADNVFAFMSDLFQKNDCPIGKVPRDNVLTFQGRGDRPPIQLRSFYSGMTELEVQARLPHLATYRSMAEQLARLPKGTHDPKSGAYNENPAATQLKFTMREYLKAHIPYTVGVQGVETFLLTLGRTGENFPDRLRATDHSLLVSHTYYLGDETGYGLPTRTQSTQPVPAYPYRGAIEPTYLFLDHEPQEGKVDLDALVWRP